MRFSLQIAANWIEVEELVNFSNLKGVAVAGALMVVSAISAVPAIAVPIIHNGAGFAATATAVDANTVSFQFTADIGDPGWLGSGGLDDLFAVRLALPGYSIDSIDAFSTNAAGTWLPFSEVPNLNGCSSSGSAIDVCNWPDPFDGGTGELGEGLLTWDFTVSFTEDLGLDTLLNENNQLRLMFGRCGPTLNPNDGDDHWCHRDVGVTQSFAFAQSPDSESTQVPAPGTLLLLGFGLAGLSRLRRRR